VRQADPYSRRGILSCVHSRAGGRRGGGSSPSVIRHGPVRSLAEAARARGMAPVDVVKTLVVRRAEDDFLFVLVPGDRAISWPKLRRLLGVSRLSMPDAEVARQATLAHSSA
jgi:Cys-tRNA(Pro)/Cys-tRNA(Cys) deacylase